LYLFWFTLDTDVKKNNMTPSLRNFLLSVAAGFTLVYLGYRALLKLATLDPVVRANAASSGTGGKGT
jgi:hypothetical protein